jgi:hypothetical protein
MEGQTFKSCKIMGRGKCFWCVEAGSSGIIFTGCSITIMRIETPPPSPRLTGTCMHTHTHTHTHFKRLSVIQLLWNVIWSVMVILLKGVNTFGILCTNCAEALTLTYYVETCWC